MKKIFKSIRTVSLCIFISSISVFAYAQTLTFKLADLESKVWEMQVLKDSKASEHFMKGKIDSFYDGKLLGSFEYYLSNNADTVFNSAKVGNSKEGKYLVKRLLADKSKINAPQPTKFSVYEIIALESSRLVIRKIEHKHILEFRLK